MDPNSADTTSRPAPPGGRRRTHKTGTSTPTTATPTDDTPPPAPTADDDRDEVPGMSTTDTQATIRPAAADVTALSGQEIDDALRGLTREDLFQALTRAKEEMDRLDALVSDQTNNIESLVANNNDLAARLQASDDHARKLQLAVQQREARVDELVYDQEKMEDEIYKKLGALERLKTRADESERKLADTERRAAEVEQAAEKDREYSQDQEALLKSQNTRLTKDNTSLKEELAHLRDTVDGLMQEQDRHDEERRDQLEREGSEPRSPSSSKATSQSQSSQPPVTPSRTPSRRLASTQSPIAMRTLASEADAEHVSALQTELEQLKKTLASQESALAQVRNSLNSERTRTAELETEKHELESMLTGNTLEQLVKGKAAGKWFQAPAPPSTTYTTDSISEEDEDDAEDSAASHSTTEDDDVDDVPDTPKTPKAHRRNKGPRTSVAMRKKQSLDHLPDALGNELSSTPTRANTKPLSADAHDELTRLRQENKNLSMYISKILNRILSMEGFERVLAHDTIDASASIGRNRRAPRHSIMPVSSNTAANAATREEQRKNRRKSAGILGFARSSSPTGAEESSSSSSQQQSSQPARASRTASVDWRNIKLPWTSSPVEEKPNPNLRPFNLSAATTRLDVPVEEDIDELERQRARALLQMEGHTVPEHQLASPSPRVGGTAAVAASSPSLTSAGGTFGALFSRVLGGGEAKSPTIAKASPTTDEGRFASPRIVRINDGLANDDADPDSSIASTTSSSTGAPLTQFTSSRSGVRRPPRPSSRVAAGAGGQGIGLEFPTSPNPADVSVAGDESYVLQQPSSSNSSGGGDDAAVASEQPPQTSWRRALRRISLMTGEAPGAGAEGGPNSASSQP